mmetsp:Transcript_34497/g.90770  ORF Transcript_34497/g.90770 Transcript_34497/m.90770 type:complete len:277 (+) Transcript_34497:345-1175(+)
MRTRTPETELVVLLPRDAPPLEENLLSKNSMQPDREKCGMQPRRAGSVLRPSLSVSSSCSMVDTRACEFLSDPESMRCRPVSNDPPGLLLQCRPGGDGYPSCEPPWRLAPCHSRERGWMPTNSSGHESASSHPRSDAGAHLSHTHGTIDLHRYEPRTSTTSVRSGWLMLRWSSACTSRKAVALPSDRMQSPRRNPAFAAGVATPGSLPTHANGLASAGRSPRSSTAGCSMGSLPSTLDRADESVSVLLVVHSPASSLSPRRRDEVFMCRGVEMLRR